MLTIAGTAAMSAPGSMTRIIMSNGVMPTLTAASIWPAGTAAKPARKISAK